MSLLRKSILAIDQLSDLEVENIFKLARQIQSDPQSALSWPAHNKIVMTLFFEPSTRTRISFQIACARMGIPFSDLGSEGMSSLSKGETPEDTLYNVAAMKPDLMIVRYGSDPTVQRTIGKLSCPVISGGGGTAEHPTQALLDAYTIIDRKGRLEGQKIVFVGDVLHSRVAHSDIRLFQRMGAELAVACPENVFKTDPLAREIKHFSDLTAAAKWADVVMGLRIQKERHSEFSGDFSEFFIDVKAMSHLKKDALIMHPGPFVPGQDLAREILVDPRCTIHQQVENGVYVRMALMAKILGLSQ